MWKIEEICSLVNKNLFVFKIRILRGSPIQMMEVSARDQGRSLLVDNDLLFIYFSRCNNVHQFKKYHNEKHDIKEKEMLKQINILIFPLFLFFRDRDMRRKVLLEAIKIREWILV